MTERHQVYRSGSHRFTVMAKKSKKHPMEMTSDELAEHVFHPKVLKHLRKVIAEQNAPEPPAKSTRKRVK